MLGRRNGQVNCGWRHNPCADGAENLSGLLFRDKESFLAQAIEARGGRRHAHQR